MFDKIISVISLIFLFPLIIIVSILIIIFSGFPILYLDKRVGLNYNKFDVIKFRTMLKNSGSSITVKDDHRITLIGKYLRFLKLDEIPQFINILKGDMSLIGPRPEAINIVNSYGNYFNYLKYIKPGITDICSIIFKNEENLLNIDKNIIYTKNILPIKADLSLLFYKNKIANNKVLILFLTFISIFNHELSLRIIGKYFLPFEEREIRIRLNKILSIKIF
tara:strand:- start:88 stop:750 length:663 start_codon:yes stop_codon:yes gene_type:complete